MNRFFTLLISALFCTAVSATQVTYRVASFNSSTGDFALEAWGEKPMGAFAYFYNDFGATAGNRYNQIPRGRQASLELYGWKGCAIRSVTFSMCSNSKSGSVGYTIVDGTSEISRQSATGFNSEQWFGEWLSKDQNVYGEIVKTLHLQPLATDTLIICVKGGTSEGSVYLNSITIDYDAPTGTTLESPLGWVYEKLQKKSTIAEGDVIMLFRSGAAACDIDGMATSSYLDAMNIGSTTDVTEPDVLQFTLGRDSSAWTLTDQYGRRLGAKGAQHLAWDEGVTTWDITIGYDGATIASTNGKYGTLRFNAPSGSYARFWNYTSKNLPLPYAYRRVRQNQPVACTGITLPYQSRTIALGACDTIMVKPTILPVKATDKRIAWASSDTSVATVKNGIVHPVGAGTAIIKATTVSGGMSAEMRLTVTERAPKGDIDGNGTIDSSDVTALINHILGTAAYDTNACDINADGTVNISDVTALITLILT